MISLSVYQFVLFAKAKEKSTWQEEEQKRLVDAVNLELEEEKDIDWVFVSIKVATRDSKQCRSQW